MSSNSIIPLTPAIAQQSTTEARTAQALRTLNSKQGDHGKIEKALTSVQAGQFLQIENQLGLFVDVTIASEMPTVGSKGK